MHTAFIFCPRPITGGTGHIFLDLDRFGYAIGYFFIVQLYLNPQVAAPASAVPSAPASTPARSAEKAAENIIAENIPELAEDIFSVHAASRATPAIVAQTCMPTCRIALVYYHAQYFSLAASLNFSSAPCRRLRSG